MREGRTLFIGGESADELARSFHLVGDDRAMHERTDAIALRRLR